MWDLIPALFIGIGAGIVTGLLPGLHVNTVAAITLGALPLLLAHFSPISLGIFLISMLITHSFLDFIPSIYLGAPDEGETALSVLPGHKLLLRGDGYKALKLTVAGGIGTYFVGLVTLPLFFILVKYGYSYLANVIAPLIIVFSAVFILSEKGLQKKVWALLVFLLSGVLGLIALNSLSIKEPLFPLLAGTFGISTLLISADRINAIPKQRFSDSTYFGSCKTHLKGAFSAALMAVLPALGAAQATILAQLLSKKKSAEEFLLMVGGINSVSVLFVLTTLFLINKSRTGVIAVMQQFLTLDNYGFAMLLASSLAALGFAVVLTLYLGRYFADKIWKIKYRKLSMLIVAFVVVLVAYFSGWMGLFLLSIATAVGLIAPKVGIKRIHAMGCIAIPIVMYFV
ncbi:MAG: tripartite tricarboxylate transporter permease [archaeon]